MDKYNLYAAAAFGVEAAVKIELQQMGIESRALDGRVEFCGDAGAIAKANINLRCADRVYIKLAEFEAGTFDELFEGVRAVRFGSFLPKDAEIFVSAKCVSSKLTAHIAVSNVIRKAIYTSMSAKYGIKQFAGGGREYHIEAVIRKDKAIIALDTSGEPLNKRGWRDLNHPAALRETLAAAIILYSGRRHEPLYDLFCGSGTLPIEAAMRELNIAPGLNRSFAAEGMWDFKDAFRNEKLRAEEQIIKDIEPEIFGFDMADEYVTMARRHAERAGLKGVIHFQTKRMQDFSSKRTGGIIITNPPYAVRLGEESEIFDLCEDFGKLYRGLDGYKACILSGFEDFERAFRCKVSKRRKLYNGGVQCNLYFYGYDGAGTKTHG